MRNIIILSIIIIVCAAYYLYWNNTSREIEHPLPMPASGKVTLDNVAPLFKHGMPKDYAVVDVRTDNEFKESHTNGTLHLPVALFDDDGACAKIKSQLPANKKIIFVCPAGPRAEEMFYDITDPVKDGGCGLSQKGMYFLYAKVRFHKNKLVLK